MEPPKAATTPCLAAVTGQPQVFVIGGGGTGIPVYRKLQRQGIPFAAGVLHQNDLDYPVAQALASVVVTQRSFEPISDEAFSQAAVLLQSCHTVLCPLDTFGSMNQKNQQLLQLAQESSKLKPIV